MASLIWLSAAVSWVLGALGAPLTILIGYAEMMKTAPKRYDLKKRAYSAALPIGSLVAGAYCVHQVWTTSSSWWYYVLIAPPMAVSAFMTYLTSLA